MKIVYLIPSLYGGGAERVLCKIIDRFSKEFDSTILLLEKGERVDVNDDVKKIHLSSVDGKYSSPTFKLLCSPLYYFKYQYQLALRKPAVVLSFLDRANVLNISPSLLRYKKIIGIRSHLSNKLASSNWKGYIVKCFYRKLLNKSNCIVVPSIAMKHDLIDNFLVPDSKVEVIYNGITPSKLDTLSYEEMDSFEYKLFFDNDVIINVGSLSKAKRQDLLISSFSLYLSKKLGAKNKKLVIIGEGDLIDSLQSLCIFNGLTFWDYRINPSDGNDFDVYFLGYKENPYKYIKQAKLFVLTSEREGFPNVLVESLFLETPVISTDCLSGPREILSNNYKLDMSREDFKVVDFGILIPPPKKTEKFDISILSNAMKYSFSVTHNNLHLRNRALTFSDEKFLSSWFNVINKVVDT
ncbi:glycosyltransferase [Vibrio splendidus]